MAGQQRTAKTPTRTMRKGATTLGLVHIPIARHSATAETDLNFDWPNQLIGEMTADWSADQFRDSFREEIMKLVEAKAKAGETETVSKVQAEPSPQRGADVIDLTELLKRSLQGAKRAPAAKTATAAKSPAGKTAARTPGKKAAPAKSATRRAA